MKALEVDGLRTGRVELPDLAIGSEIADIVEFRGDALAAARRQLQRAKSPAEADMVLVSEAEIPDNAHGVTRHGGLERRDRLLIQGQGSVQTGDFTDEPFVKLAYLHVFSRAIQWRGDAGRGNSRHLFFTGIQPKRKLGTKTVLPF